MSGKLTLVVEKAELYRDTEVGSKMVARLPHPPSNPSELLFPSLSVPITSQVRRQTLYSPIKQGMSWLLSLLLAFGLGDPNSLERAYNQRTAGDPL